MTTHATSSIAMNRWQEQPFAESDGAPKLARAEGSDLYHGDIEGEATFEFLMLYRDDGVTSYIGLERVVGRISERQGSFVLQVTGTHQEGLVQANVSVVTGSGTGDLRGLTGAGELHWQKDQGTIMLDYNLA